MNGKPATHVLGTVWQQTLCGLGLLVTFDVPRNHRIVDHDPSCKHCQQATRERPGF